LPGTSPERAIPPLTPKIHLVPASRAGERLDRFLAEVERSLSRSAVQNLIDAGHVRLNEGPARASRRVREGDRVEVVRPRRAPSALAPEAIPLEVVYEDEHLAVIDKPAGMVVHPAVGHRTGTLVHALLHRYGHLSSENGAERAGIVHRLDKGTSGLLLVARTDEAHRTLAAELEARKVRRVYRALVWGHPREAEGRIEAPLGRHPKDRKRIAVLPRGGRYAATRYQVVRSYAFLTELLLSLETGRTHQIRVHLAHQGQPVFGDPDYGGRRGPLLRLPPAQREEGTRLLAEIEHQALHAETIGFTHPATGEAMEFTRRVPPEFAAVLDLVACGS
jgi:23S rRNA pseudouridine1911/1915/1917 synthase